MSGITNMSGNDVFTTERVKTPMNRLQMMGRNNARVMELLWADWEINGNLNAGNEAIFVEFSIGIAPTAQLGMADPSVFIRYRLEINILGRSVSGLYTTPYRYNFQSSDGFGYLLATDAFNVGIGSENTGNTSAIAWKLFYRFVDVPMSEFVGIVQSQQN